MTLADLLRSRGRMDPEEFLPVFRRIVDAVQLYHVDHPMHGDLRPVNILLTDTTASLKTHGTDDPPRDYLAPEQITGRMVSRATDMYALGIIAFEMLAGRNPVVEMSPAARTSGNPPSLAAEAPHTPQKIVAAVDRCLAIDPEKRFRSMRELLEAVGRAVPSKGIALGAVLPEEPPDAREAVHLFRETVAALRRFHDAKAAHVAISPDSIRIRETGEVDLAAAAGPDDAYPDPKYAAPEAILSGAPPAADPVGDIYALGFLFYEVLLGSRRFAAEFSETVGRGSDLAWTQWHADPARRARPLLEIRANLPPGLVEVVGRMMEKNALSRVRSLEQVQEELARVDAGLAG